MHRSRSRRGANAVEFGLLLPAFLLLLGGAMELSWLVFEQGAVRTAVARGCRTGSLVDPGQRDVQINTTYAAASQAVLDQFAANGGGACPGCTVTVTSVGEVPNRSLQCTLALPYVGLTALVGGTVSGNITDSVVVRMEYQRRATP